MPESSLRMRVVEAGARAMHVRTGKPRGPLEPFVLDAEAALDAMLDCLTKNADETIHPSYNDEPHPWRLFDASVEDLLAVLREDR